MLVSELEDNLPSGPVGPLVPGEGGEDTGVVQKLSSFPVFYIVLWCFYQVFSTSKVSRPLTDLAAYVSLIHYINIWISAMITSATRLQRLQKWATNIR